MEDEKGLDLSLGLPCGGNSSLQKGKYGSSPDTRPDEGDRGSKLINEFKNFLEGGNQQHPLNVGENFYTNFSKGSVDLETSKNSNTEGIWLKNDSRSTEDKEEKRSVVGEKRQNPFNETNHQKKYETDAIHADDLTDRTKTSHISITTDEGSTADNEDVADSEVNGSTSMHVPQHDDLSKRFVSRSLKESHEPGSLSRAWKESHEPAESNGVEILGHKRFTMSSEKEFNAMNMPAMPYNVQFSGHLLNMNTSSAQPIKDHSASGKPNLPSYPLPSMLHGMDSTNGEQPVMPANFPLLFGYTPVQIPSLDRDNSRGVVSHHQMMHPTYSGRKPVNPDTQNDNQKQTLGISHVASESTQYDEKAVAHGKSYGKQQVGEEGSSSHPESDLKGNTEVHQVKDASDQPRTAESSPTEFAAIRPGIAADLKFGGCGSYPNLPWVSTTGQGPNGRTISGVTYKYSPSQIRIVCACHGSHMSPDEFVRHASAVESNSPDTATAPASFPSSNPAASAQS